MILASTQFEPVQEDILNNLEKHYHFIEVAASHHANLILFPEMSMTSYLRTSADKLAFTPDDPRLKRLKELAITHQLIIIAGAPIQQNNKLYIGSFSLLPDGRTEIYTKHYLHEGEDTIFSGSFDYDPEIRVNGEIIRQAICADIDHPEHAKAAAKKGATLYLPSIFFSANGIGYGHEFLQSYAKKHHMNVLMSNFCGQVWDTKSGGRSAFWDNTGKLIASLNEKEEGLLLIEKQNNGWKNKTIKL